MKIDPYKHKERYLSWKASINGRIPNLSEKNSKIIFEYILDMENGLNVASVSKKGARSYIRLNTLREKLIFFSKRINELYEINNLAEIKEEQLILFFSKMRKGKTAC